MIRKDHRLLLEAYKLLDATLEATADGILAVDRGFNILKYNRKFVEMFSVPEDILKQMDYRALLEHSLTTLRDPGKFREEVDRIAVQPHLTVENILELTDGRVYKRTSKPVILDDEIIGRVLSFTDISELKKSEVKHQQLYSRLKFHIDNSPLAVIEFDHNQRIIGWSKMAESIFGWESREVFGKKYDDLNLVYEADIEAVAGNVTETLHTRLPNIHRNRNYRKDGTLLWCEWYNSPMCNDDGSLVSVLSVVKDISENVKAEELLTNAYQFNLQIVNGIQVGLVVLDRDLNILIWNPVMERYSGLPTSMAVGKNASEFFPEPGEDGMVSRLRKALSGEITTKDLQNNSGAGTARWATNTATPLRDNQNNITGLMVTVHDITHLKEIEDSLRIRIGRLTELNQELEDYAYAIQELSQFSYVASHQLQAPVRTISNFISVIKEDYGDKLDEKVLRYLHTIRESAGRMSDLIDALLEYARIGRKSSREECDLSKLVAELLSDLSFLIKSSGAELEVGPLPVLMVHRIEFRQLIQNLITNAVKFQKPGNKPFVRIEAERLEDRWRFSVSDNGIGIHSKYFEKIFDIFQRLHADESVYEGKGIGLAYSKKIVELHKGELWVESFSSEGCTFFFTIPDSE